MCIFLCVHFCGNIRVPAQSVQLHVHISQEETQLQAKPSERATGFVPTK